jgi:hypothetical protein
VEAWLGARIAAKDYDLMSNPGGTGGVSDLHLKYLEASFEAARKASVSAQVINAGAVVGAVGLIRALAQSGIAPQVAVRALSLPILLFVAGVALAVSTLLALHVSAHNAAWGNAVAERISRWGAWVLLALSLSSFAIAVELALSAITAIPVAPQQIG